MNEAHGILIPIRWIGVEIANIKVRQQDFDPSKNYHFPDAANRTNTTSRDPSCSARRRRVINAGLHL